MRGHFTQITKTEMIWEAAGPSIIQSINPVFAWCDWRNPGKIVVRFGDRWARIHDLRNASNVSPTELWAIIRILHTDANKLMYELHFYKY